MVVFLPVAHRSCETIGRILQNMLRLRRLAGLQLMWLSRPVFVCK